MLMNNFTSAWGHTTPIGLVSGFSIAGTSTSSKVISA